jgi:hypothetical protein
MPKKPTREKLPVNIFEEVIYRGEIETVTFQIYSSKDSSPNITIKFEDTFFKIPILNKKCSYEQFLELVDIEAEKYYQNKITVCQAELDYFKNKIQRLQLKKKDKKARV